MRKSTVIKIDDKEYSIKELRVKDIYGLIDGGEEQSLFDKVDTLLPKCSDLDRDQLMEMTPSDLLILWEGFKEVNAAFLQIAAAAGFSADMIRQGVASSLQEQ